jgi:GR25 family glycosyltransferase involved in LPS biosynthesis
MVNFDIYVINLDKDTDRLTKITKKLDPNKFIRIPAVYGKEIDLNNNDDITPIKKKNETNFL